ncbi:MAG TPA: cupin domain-containing protein [Puia sp.]|nr:cupin domain-containing protein [Puia sp.]
MEYLTDIPAREIRPGFFGKLVHGEKSTLAIWEIKKGSRLVEHSHHHEQITFVLEGELEMIIGGEKYLMKAGATHAIPSNVPHSAFAHTDVKVIDSFAPARDDYR